jgi:GntR family transcriptional regulator
VSEIAKTYERSRVPLYLQVATTLRRRIESGQWQPGERISTLDELEREFQVARVTVRQAVELLQKEGLVQRRQGKGTFVETGFGDRRWLKLEVDWDSLVATIRENVPHFLAVPDVPPPPRLHPGDGRPAPSYRYLRSVQSRDGEAYALASVHIASALYERDPAAFGRRAALAVLSAFDDIEISRAHQTFLFSGADPLTAEHLEIPLNSPTAEAHCVVVDDEGVAIYVGDIIYRGDRIKLDIDLMRDRRRAT